MKLAVKSATLLAAIGTAILFTHTAQAADLGMISGFKGFESASSSVTFEDLYTFTVGGNRGATIVVTAIGSSDFGVEISSTRLYRGDYSTSTASLIANSGPVSITPIGTFPGTVGTTILTTSTVLAPLTTYTLVVNGVNHSDDAYAGSILLSPVPEPDTLALLLAGMGMIGMIAQRRQRAR